MQRRTAFAFAMMLGLAGPALAQDRTPSPPNAAVYFISPADGATVSNPVIVRFGLRGMGIAPAGVEKPNTGHHHLLIDVPASEIDLASNIPADAQHVHFGGGQTETSVTLPPGRHRLQLLLADQNHLPHLPPVMSPVITIQVR